MNKKIFALIKHVINLPFFVPLIIFISSFSVYVSRLSPTVFGGDSGDFLSAVITKGIPHPSGYPLYTLIGILFNMLPFGPSSAWRVELSSALYASLAVVFLYLISIELTKNKIISAITAYILAFLYPFWIYAEIAEIFSLHYLFVVLISYLTIKLLKSGKIKFLYLLSFFIGLSLTNNLTIVLLLPGVGISILFTHLKLLKNIRVLLKCFLLFLCGLLPYAYIPIAASYYPVVNWDRVVNFSNFISLVTRKDYGWIHQNNDPFFPYDALRSFFVYWKEYVSALFILLFISGILGFLTQKKYKIFLYLIVTLFTTGPLFIIYTKTPTNSLSALYTLERFYLTPMIVVIIFFSEGIAFIAKVFLGFLKRNILKKIIYVLILAAFSTLPISLYLENIQKTDLTNIYIGEYFAEDILKSLDKDSFLFVASDESAFNTLYIQNEYGFRKDITIPGRNTGFEKFLETSKILKADKIDNYLTDNRNTVLPEDMYGGIVSLLESGYSVYSTIPKLIVENKLGKLATIPYGLIYKFTIGKESVPSKEEYIKTQDKIINEYRLYEFQEHKDAVNYSLSLSTIKRHYAEGFRNIANFMKLYFKDENMYKKYMDMAAATDPILSKEGQ